MSTNTSGKKLLLMDRQEKQESRTHNSTFAIGGVQCSADTLVVNQSLVLRINICGKNPAHRKSAKPLYGNPKATPYN
jgi:hypothetical protein